GYENATVEARPQQNAERTEVNIVYAVREGPQVIVDHVLIVGPDRTDASIVEKQLQLRAGDPLSRNAVLDTQQRLRSLGLYRSVTEYPDGNTFREPKVFNTPIDGLITLTVEQQFRSSFNFRRRSATAEATRRLGGGLSLIGTYQLQQTNVYDVTSDQNLIDR